MEAVPTIFRAKGGPCRRRPGSSNHGERDQCDAAGTRSLTLSDCAGLSCCSSPPAEAVGAHGGKLGGRWSATPRGARRRVRELCTPFLPFPLGAMIRMSVVRAREEAKEERISPPRLAPRSSRSPFAHLALTVILVRHCVAAQDSQAYYRIQAHAVLRPLRCLACSVLISPSRSLTSPSRSRPAGGLDIFSARAQECFARTARRRGTGPAGQAHLPNCARPTARPNCRRRRTT